MVMQCIIQGLRDAEELKQRIQNSSDLIGDEEALTARFQLQKILNQILILDLDYAINKKVEQDLWNMGFKNYIDTLQKLVKDKKNPKRSEHQVSLNGCLESAIGFYSVLLEEICMAFSVNLPFSSYRKFSYIQSDLKKSNVEQYIKRPQKSSCFYICQHCLVHLGDLSRYKLRCKQAEIFYRNAIVINSSSGQPYNQLALLETSRGNKLATVFYYIRSIAVRNPFPAASSNLSLTLNKINVNYERDIENRSVLSTSEFITLFLRMHALLHFSVDILPCAQYVRLLTTSLTAHVATESFTTVNLVQLMAINMYAYYNANMGKKIVSSEIKSSEDEKFIKAVLLELIVGSLNAFLLPIYTHKQEDSLLQYFALPAIKIAIDWIRLNSNVLEEAGFVNKPQIWPAFCKLVNELVPLLKSFPYDKYANTDLPEEQELQGFIPLQIFTNEFKFANEDVDLDNINKVRAYRIIEFASWLANEKERSLINKCKTENDDVKFEAISTGVQSSNELIIQQLEELLKTDCKVSETITTNKNENVTSNDNLISTKSNKIPLVVSTSVDNILVNSPTNTHAISDPNIKNKRSGILKTSGFLNKKDKSNNNDYKKNSRQNIALQTILKRNQEQEHKQVTFKTPSPSLSASSDNVESVSPSVSQSQFWFSKNINNNSNNNNGITNIGNCINSTAQPPIQLPTNSMYNPSFPTYRDSLRSLPQPLQSNSVGQLTPPVAHIDGKNSKFFPSNFIQDIPPLQDFSSQIRDKSFNPLLSNRVPDSFANNSLNSITNMKNQNYFDNSVNAVTDNRSLTRTPYVNSSNSNFLPTWKQDSNPWWIDDKPKVTSSSITNPVTLNDDQNNSFYHFRNPIYASQTVQPSPSIPFSGDNQILFHSQKPLPHQLHSLPPQQQQQQQQSSLPPQQLQQQPVRPEYMRSQNPHNNLIELWSNGYKPLQPPQNNTNSMFSSNIFNKSYFDQNVTSNMDDKNIFSSNSQLPNNSYSLFNPIWSNSSIDNQFGQPTNNNPLTVLTSQSIWSGGVSPLQKLLEQQKQIRE